MMNVGAPVKVDTVEVPFRGRHIVTVNEDDGVWVALKQTCRMIGIDSHGQRVKLSLKPWARIKIFRIKDAKQHRQRVVFVHLSSVGRWLDEIDMDNIPYSIRPKLSIFRRDLVRTVSEYYADLASRPQDEMDVVIRDLGNIRARVDKLECGVQSDGAYSTLDKYCEYHDLTYRKTDMRSWGNRIAAYCRTVGIEIKPSLDKWHNWINSYPTRVIAETFERIGPPNFRIPPKPIDRSRPSVPVELG